MIAPMFGQGSDDGGDDLESRKQRLLQFLHQNGAQRPYGAQPLFGAGRSSHGGSDFPQAALPGLTFNPFLSQIAGRGENFPQLPAGIDRITAGNVQGNAPNVIGGMPAPGAGGPAQAAPGIAQRQGVSGIPTQPLGSDPGPAQAASSPLGAPRSLFPSSPYQNPLIRDLTGSYFQPNYAGGNVHYAV